LFQETSNKIFINRDTDRLVIPPVQFVGLVVSVVPEDLDVVEHALDDLLGPLKLSLDLVAVVLGVLWVEGVHALRLVLDPGLDVVQLGVGVLRLLVDLLSQALKLFEPEIKVQIANIDLKFVHSSRLTS
jgi:hypothetical protein